MEKGSIRVGLQEEVEKQKLRLVTKKQKRNEFSSDPAKELSSEICKERY